MNLPDLEQTYRDHLQARPAKPENWHTHPGSDEAIDYHRSLSQWYQQGADILAEITGTRNRVEFGVKPPKCLPRSVFEGTHHKRFGAV